MSQSLASQSIDYYSDTYRDSFSRINGIPYLLHPDFPTLSISPHLLNFVITWLLNLYISIK
jgi:hypothetical protein